MATGLTSSQSSGNHIWRILEGATATNSPPSGSSAGHASPAASNPPTILPLPSSVVALVYSTAGSATMTVTVKLWGYLSVPAVWVPLGTGADLTKGTLNAGAAIGETSTDVLRHSEVIANLFAFDRIYAEITAIGGTSTAINVDIVIGPAGRD